MQNDVLSKLTVQPSLALEFLAIFSRLEYALKVTNFSQSTKGEAKADWGKFIAEINKTFDPNKSTILNDAFNYLLTHQLKMLGFENNNLNWILFDVSTETTNLEKVIRKIKQIRNNLFHGGKYAQINPDSKNNDPLLLAHSITVLLEIKQLIRNVSNAYDY